MKKLMKVSNEGFTLVELMIVVAIIGILATIAVPQYAKFTAKSKQTEIRIALGAINTVESSFAVENNSYNGCLGNIGYSRDGTKFYYTVGFGPAVAGTTACAPDGSQACTGYQWSFDNTVTPAVYTPVATAICTAATANTDYFPANTSNAPASLPTQADLAGVPINTSIGFVAATGATFVAGGVANLLTTKKDYWTIDQSKQMLNVQSGL